ncbi:MAG: glycoside hydrolase family 3 C-terminal domain-containing protein [Opitutales bacterium]|nr:glycoside hydrolase family 3 C-terminal domain-containing protein [Opitutales bacterium]
MKYTKDYRLGFTAKAQEILDQLTLEEKVYLMSGRMSLEQEMRNQQEDPDNLHYNYVPYPAGGIERLGVPTLLFCDGPRGVVCSRGKSTCFPVPMLRGASFDVALEEQIGRAIAAEILAYGGNYFGGVCINLPYNPGWGRSQETYGEESFLLGKMGAALVRGVQSGGVIACIKHYAFNQMENARFKVNVTCDKRTEREVYLPHFKDCIDAGAASVMSSYNKYQGTYCGHNAYLLNDVLKGEWNFDGFVISDFYWGVKDTVEAANGGQNIEMAHTKFFGEKLLDAVKAGSVNESTINDAALRIIRTLLAFEDTKPENADPSVLACPEHVDLALQSAREGITLLQNKNDVLPFEADKIRKILVIGELGRVEPIGDHGSSWVRPPYVISPLEGIRMAAPDAEVTFDDGKDLDRAKALAKEADAVVMVLGYDHNDEGEFVSAEAAEGYTGSMGGDRRRSLGLHRPDIALIQALGPCNANTAVVLIGGNTIMISEWKDEVSAILMAYYPGMEGGRALGEILFGAINPSGKLPFVLPGKETDLPQVDWDADEQFYDYYHGYTRLDKAGIQPLLPFGFGLSYTRFAFSDAEFGGDDEGITVTCTVTNTGEREGTDVVQLYVGFKNSALDRPVRVLRAFDRVSLKPGDSRRVTLQCPMEKLRYFDEKSGTMKLEQIPHEVYIGNACSDAHLLAGSVDL